ncbi:gibberellin 2-beta-dioxygenase 8 [Amborella trichopoda]|uniref:gibberellin 2beta-dioxygenase n=1 Tax=Amborella trichopoda TaxID=13333 RepID=W1PQN9_AMBTC|nr:gibberellin 2-beta-dioxygenase 8 [Amborella trichopoda]ERN09535.1 hypothetical protein AMTR_s00029p00142300 [Amborella trichopoda]|eukprot:XP_006847954.1 gibberellin 2-beta-dioxygenase 8 [Amborella trichopoda]
MTYTKTGGDPPLIEKYGDLFHESRNCRKEAVEECGLPLIDLQYLSSSDEAERQACISDMATASSEWGFFQVVNHGISDELVERMRKEQRKVFEMAFEKKRSSSSLNDSYRWGGAPNAPSVNHMSWSEAFHVPLSKISDHQDDPPFNSLRLVMKEFAKAMAELALSLSGILARKLGQSPEYFPENCDERTCFLRLNRYPPCPFSPDVCGLVPHTDSDFLTILCQDQVGGLQLMKDSKWVSVKPNSKALIVNIGDLFQAWSNGAYKSVEHRVMTNPTVERHSIAYFLCPSYEAPISTSLQPPLYKKFTFREFRQQVQEDVKKMGYKIGLPRFLL